MITDWTGEDGIKAKAAMGWEELPPPYNSIALAILRDHAREWLEKRAIRISTLFNGKSGIVSSYIVERELRNDDGYYEGDGPQQVLCVPGWRTVAHHFADEPVSTADIPIKDGEYFICFDDYDQCLIAAVLGAGEAQPCGE